MSRSVRFFEIIQILRQANEPVTARVLAEKLEVNVRTIYRDIASLQASKLPIEGEAGIGYVMRSGFDLPPLMFSQEELEAVVVGLSLLGRSGDSGLVDAAESVAAKISSVLPDSTTFNPALHTSSWNKIPSSKIQPEEFRKLIRQESEIEIIYLDLKERRTRRLILPIALFYYIDAIILVAWCKLRKGFRNFRIDRIQHWELTGNFFSDEATQLREKWETEARQREYVGKT